MKSPHADSNILRAVLASADDSMVVTDLDGIILKSSRGVERLYGYRADELVGRSIAVLLPDGHQSEVERVLAVIRGGQAIERLDTTRRTMAGMLIHVAVRAEPIRNGDGEVVGMLSVARDRTAEISSARALAASDERWRATIESAVDGIIVIDARGIIESFNPAAERLFGYTRADVLGRNVSMLMPSPYREEHDAYLARYLNEGSPRVIGIGREVVGQRKDGTTFPLHLAVGEMALEGVRKFTGIVHDLSGRVEMEEQLREQTSLARLGEMAAVIAHEVKNPLAGVRGAIQVIGGRLPANSPDAAIVKEILGRIDSLNELMKDMLLFARPPQPKPTATEIAPLVASTATLLVSDPSLRDVRVDVEGAAPPVAADADLLRIVFLNLLVNSAHAMNGRGTVKVSVGASDTTCSVVFADSGPGIPTEIRDKVFTPFFTTKARGTGLGLPTAKRLIEAHRGTIGVECPPQGGTAITIQLPISR
jgi:two-component system sensor kinase FixL